MECRGRTGCAARPLEKPERAWRRRSRASERDSPVLPLVPSTVGFETLCPRPGSLPALTFGAADPAEPPLRLGALWTRCAAVRSTLCEQPGAGVAWRGVFLVLLRSAGPLAVQGPYLLHSLTAALEGIPRRPPANPAGELGALQLPSAAPLGARGAGRLRGDPAPRRRRDRGQEPTACPSSAGCGPSRPRLFSYSVFSTSLPAPLQEQSLSSGRLQRLTVWGPAFYLCCGVGPEHPTCRL